MKLTISETPQKWVILKLITGDYKIFATWAGGYLDGDGYRTNSGIVKVEQDDDYYYFIGYSGSCYKCHKKGYGVATSYGSDVLNSILEMSKGQAELMKDQNDWSKII